MNPIDKWIEWQLIRFGTWFIEFMEPGIQLIYGILYFIVHLEFPTKEKQKRDANQIPEKTVEQQIQDIAYRTPAKTEDLIKAARLLGAMSHLGLEYEFLKNVIRLYVPDDMWQEIAEYMDELADD